MSGDVLRPLLKAVADLPDYHTGLVLQVVKQLKGPHHVDVARRLRKAITVSVKKLGVMEIIMHPTDDHRDFLTVKNKIYISAEAEGELFGELILGEGRYFLSRHLVEKSYLDSDIKTVLPKDYVFSAMQFCGLIAQMLKKQPNGEEGDLLVSSLANIFYVMNRSGTKELAACVFWDSNLHGWKIRVYPLDMQPWNAGAIVFTPHHP